MSQRLRDAKGRFVAVKKPQPIDPALLEAVKASRAGKPAFTDWGTVGLTLKIYETTPLGPKKQPWRVVRADEE